jgi:hypothetical protein
VTVYVDEFRRWGPTKLAIFRAGSSHLTADTLDELHALAQRIGLRREWFQDHRLHPHYDLTKARRAAALLAGAVFVSAKEQAEKRLARLRHVRPGCALGEGSRWASCDCAEIDQADRPCVTCDAIAESAKVCPGCEHERASRV